MSDYAAALAHWRQCKKEREEYEALRDSLPNPGDMNDHELMSHFYKIHCKLLGESAQSFEDFQRDRITEHEAICEDEAQTNSESYREHGPMILQLALEQIAEDEEDREWSAAYVYSADAFGDGCASSLWSRNEAYWWANGPARA